MQLNLMGLLYRDEAERGLHNDCTKGCESGDKTGGNYTAKLLKSNMKKMGKIDIEFLEAEGRFGDYNIYIITMIESG
jgi:hypothetical protein